MKCLLMGCGGREAVIAKGLSEKFNLYAVMNFENISITEYVTQSGGKYLIDETYDKEKIKQFVKENEIEYCVVNSDGLLEAGMIDLAKECNMKTFGPTRRGAQVEWDKEYAINLMEKIAPEALAKTYIITKKEELVEVRNHYVDESFVVKPNGLTGGKGVKVGGEHFKTLEEGFDYAEECLDHDGVVIIQDKMVGHEFTIMGFTDGENIVFAPPTYDYPYRLDGDKGPGTGGMGCVTYQNHLLPFLNQEDLDTCHAIMKKALKEINKDRKEFNGVLYGAFFKTQKGILFIEFNSRLGDPESLNVLSVLENSFADVVKTIADGESLNQENCKFAKKDSYVLYIVSKGYAIEKNAPPITYQVKDGLREEVEVFYANTKKTGEETYQSVGNSRLFALVKTGEEAKKIKEEVDAVAKKYIVDEQLDYRKDIGVIE